MQRIVINEKHGGFGISDAAYEKLIEWGVPVKKYKEQKIDPETNLYLPEPENEGEIIFDRDGDSGYMTESIRRLSGNRYWDDFLDKNRSHPLLLRAVDELGAAANGKYAKLKIVEIPDDVEWEIAEYDGLEWVAECHRTWS